VRHWLIPVLLFCTVSSLTAVEWRRHSPIDVVGTLDLPWQVGILIPPTVFWLSLHFPQSPTADDRDVGGFYSTRLTVCQSYYADRAMVYMPVFSIGDRWRSWLSSALEAYLVELDDPRGSTWGAGGDVIMRWHLLQRFGASLYYEWELGFIVTEDVFPPGGTRLNFAPSHALGLRIPLNDDVHLLMAYQHVHISNGDIFGDRNPGFDSNGAYLGVQVRR